MLVTSLFGHWALFQHESGSYMLAHTWNMVQA